jgi:hypothetical protein
MIGMNVIFHLVSAFALLALIFLWAKEQARLQRLRKLVRETFLGDQPRMLVAKPTEFLADTCKLVGVECEFQGGAEQLRRLEGSKILAALAHVQRVRITPGLVEIYGGQRSDSLAAALGQKVEWRN